MPSGNAPSVGLATGLNSSKRFAPMADEFQRPTQLSRLTSGQCFDLLVIGGGATGAGIAVDAASRGYCVALCEQHDFGKGTSSRSTKLVHGGVRYLQQGHIRLVRDALRERGLLLRNAPHLVSPLQTIIPLYHWWEPTYYRTGLKAYDLLAGRLNLAPSQRLSLDETLAAVPTLRSERLRGGVCYYDAAFDDSRLLVNLLQTAVAHGGVCVNYAQVVGLLKEGGKVSGAEIRDCETDETHSVRAKVVVNAAGPFGDEVSKLANNQAEPQLQVSQGVHIVLDQKFLPGSAAMIVPRTEDGRVVFAIPWHHHTLVGTTDTPRDAASLEPVPLDHEIEFLLATIGKYLQGEPQPSHVLSAFAGLRPLVRRAAAKSTASLGRDHQVRAEPSGLVSMLGGKWTTYRKMAEDCVDQCIALAGLTHVACETESLPIRSADALSLQDRLDCYGDDAPQLRELIASDPAYAKPLDSALPYTVGEVVWAVRHEMARTVEDVLSRRLRILLLDAAAAVRAAPRVAELVANELGHNVSWAQRQVEQFTRLAAQYRVDS